MSRPGWHPEIPSDGLTYDGRFGPVDSVAVNRVFAGIPIDRELNLSETIALYEKVLDLPMYCRIKGAGTLNPGPGISAVLGVTPKIFRDRVLKYSIRKNKRLRELDRAA